MDHLRSCDLLCIYVLRDFILANGIVPDYLKQSKVIPLYKKGNRDNPGNYRPISLLSILIRSWKN